jgi:hypothetical protein
MLGEHSIETVEVTLVLHERKPSEPIKLLSRTRGDPGLERLEQRQELRDRSRDTGGSHF